MTEQIKSPIIRKAFAIGITCLLAWLFTYLALNIYTDYALVLFIWLPFFLGILSTLIYAYKNNTTKSDCRNVALITLPIYCLGLLIFALEGIICIVMISPLALLVAWIGFLIGYGIINNKIFTNPTALLIILIVSTPLLMSFEHEMRKKKTSFQLRSIITSVEINADASTVWKNVIEFPQLPPPGELIFKAGIAYPINATIAGEGVGAIRKCNFSTGSFIEPITVWDEPTLLKFDVLEQPEVMKELSFYELHPNHLHGYFVSKHGEFKLTALPNGNTLLEGTTWYYNKIQPAFYWNLWSDYIVHKIHHRVLEHIKIQSEI